MVQQKKPLVRTPWDPAPYEVTEVKGSRVRVQRGDLMYDRAKNNIKVLKERPEKLQIKAKKIIKEVEELDLDVNLEKIRNLSAAQPGQGGGGHPLGQAAAHQPDLLPGVPGAGEEEGQGEEEQQVRPAREKNVPERLQYSRLGTQESNQKEKLSPRARKRMQSQAKFKRKEEPLRTEMRIKERWLTREGME